MQNINHFLIFSNTYNPKHPPTPQKKESPHHKSPQKKSECSECSELLRVLQKSYRKKSTTLKKSECSELLRVLPKKLSPKKIPTQSPSSSPKPSTNSALQRLTITSTKPHKSPHHFVIAPRPTTHYLCSQKSQISHVHKHNAFQFRLRNRNISSS